ncbi:MAG: pyrimidine reductase family protein, partial [Actinomycetota bacterium]
MRVLLALDDLGRWAPGHEGTMDSEALALAYAYPEPTGSQPFVRANFISSMDGAAAGGDGRSGSINTGSDRDVFALLRALSDVILVGAGTARIEGYRRATVRAPWQGQRTGRPAHPTMAVVSRSADIPPRLSQARENSGDVLLFTCTRAGHEAIDLARGTLGAQNVIVEGDDSVDLPAALGALAQLGLLRVLCEGGPHLMGDLTAAGRLDELCLTLSPTLVVGDHPRITAGPPATLHLLPRLLIESQGTILGRWSRT